MSNTSAESLGWAAGVTILASAPGLPQQHISPGPDEGLAVFRMKETEHGAAAEMLQTMAAVGSGQPHLGHGLDSSELQQAVEIYGEIRAALANDGRIDAQEAISILGKGLQKAHLGDLAGGFAGGLIERILGKKKK